MNLATIGEILNKAKCRGTVSMNKKELIGILGSQVRENESCTGLSITLNGGEIIVTVNLPYETHELQYEAKNKAGETLVIDCHECNNDNIHFDDYKECLLDIVDIAKSPKFRAKNENNTIEAFGYRWYYFFGEFIS
jgi:hypothetical protein